MVGLPNKPMGFPTKTVFFCGVLGGTAILGNPHIGAGRVLRHTLIFTSRNMVKGGDKMASQDIACNDLFNERKYFEATFW